MLLANVKHTYQIQKQYCFRFRTNEYYCRFVMFRFAHIKNVWELIKMMRFDFVFFFYFFILICSWMVFTPFAAACGSLWNARANIGAMEEYAAACKTSAACINHWKCRRVRMLYFIVSALLVSCSSPLAHKRDIYEFLNIPFSHSATTCCHRHVWLCQQITATTRSKRTGKQQTLVQFQWTRFSHVHQ